ncbi:phage tail tape measure protein [Deinococcus sp. UYEF24]
MSTSVGSAHLDLTASTAKALATLRAFGPQAVAILKPLSNIDLKIKTTILKPKVADVRAALAGVTATVKIDIAVKPLTQRALNAALVGVTGEKKIKITVDSADAATRIANIRTVLSNLGTTVRNLFNINTTALTAVLTAGTAMLTRFGTVITDLRALITQLNAAGGRPTGPPGGGGAGGSAAASGYSAQLKLLQADLKAGALNTGSFDTATRALKTTIDAEIASLRGLGVLTADQQKKLDGLRISSGQAGAALKGLGTGPAASISQLGRELDIATSKFNRGELTLREYLREQQRITAAGTALQGSLRAGSTEAQNLERVMRGLKTAAQGINAQGIAKINSDLAQARAKFEQATTAARNFSERGAAIVDYQRSISRLEQSIAALGRRTNLTAQETTKLASLQARLAREQNALQGGTSPLGLGGAVLNALRAAFPLVQQVGGSLGAAASQAGQFGGGLSGILTQLGPVGLAIGAAALALGVFGVAASKALGAFTEFQSGIQNAKATLGLFGEQGRAVGDDLAKLASSTAIQKLGFDSTQAASAIEELGSRGLNTTEILGGGLETAAKLAAASGVKDLNVAAEVLVGTMRAFGIEGTDAARIPNLLANAANVSALKLEDFRLAIAAGGSAARTAGIGVDDFTTIISLMRDRLISASDAGTSFKSFVGSLTPNSKEAAAAMKSIGFSAFDASGSTKSFRQIVVDLSKGLEGLTTQQRLTKLEFIFGSDGARVATTALDNYNKKLADGTNAFDERGKALHTLGTEDNAAAERLDSLKGKQLLLSITTKQLAIDFGAKLAPAAGAVVGALQNVVTSIANAGPFIASLPGILYPAVVAFVAFRASVIATAASTAWTTLAGLLAALPVQIATAKAALLAFAQANPIGIIATIAAGVTAYANKIISDTQAAYAAIEKSSNDSYQQLMSRVGQLTKAGTEIDKVKAKYLLATQQLTEVETGNLTGVDLFGNATYKVDTSQLEKAQARVKSLRGELTLLQTELARKPPPTTSTPAPKLAPGPDLTKILAQARQLQATFAATKPGTAAYIQAQIALNNFSGSSQEASIALQGLTSASTQARKTPPVTAQGLADLNTFKTSLKDMTLEQLKAAQASALGSNNKRQESAILSELNRRQKDGTKAVQTHGIALTDLKKALRSVSEEELASRATSARARNDTAAYNAVLAEQARRHTAVTTASRQGVAQTQREAAARVALVRELRQSIESFKLLSDQHKVTATTQLNFNHRIEDFQDRISKLSPELQKGTGALISQAQQLSKNAGLHVAAAKKAKDQTDSARELTRQLTDLNERFKLQTKEGKVTADSLLAYQQRLAGLGEKASKLPATLQGILTGLFVQGQTLATAGQNVVAYNGTLDKLKVAVKDYTFAELESARARVVAAGGDKQKLALIDAEIKKYKQLTGAQVDQADAESKLATASTGVSGLERQRDNALAAAKGNLAEIYRITLDYGQRIQDAQEGQARAQADKDVQDVLDKYQKLLDLAGISEEQRLRLESDRADEVVAIDDGLTNTLAKNSSDRLSAETEAKRVLDERLRTMSRESRDTIRKDLLEGLKRDTAALEAAQQEELDAEDLTEGQKLAIRQRYQPLLLAQKVREVEAARAIDVQAEGDRYDDAVAAAKLDGTFAVQEANLLKVHTAELTRINRDYDDQGRDYSLGVKRDTGKQLVAAQKETSGQLLDEAKGHVADILDTVDTNEAAQRESARNTLTFWRTTYAAMGLAGKASVAEIDLALKKLDVAGEKARTEAGKLIAADPAGVQKQGESDLAAIGRPDDIESARAKAEGQFDTLRETYDKRLAELKAGLGKFADIVGRELTPDETRVRNGLLATQKLYQGLLAKVVTASGKAGDLAATVFTQAQADRLAEASLALAEANKNLAESTGGDDAAAYRAALVNYQTYWSDRVKVLQKGVNDTQKGTPAYEAAVAALIEANGKLAGSNKQLADSDKAVLDKRDAAIDAALQLAEAQRTLAVQRGQDGDAAYSQGLQVALEYWKGRKAGLLEGSPEYLAALQKVTELEGKVLALKSDSPLTRALDSASGIFSGSNGFSSLIKTSLDGLSTYFKNGGSEGGSRSLLLGAAALVSGLAAVFTTGDAEMDKVTNTFVNGVTSVLSKLASGDTVGVIISGVATVVSTIVDIFSGGANSAKKAAEDIASATSGVRFFDLSKYAKTVSAGGFFGFLGFKKSEIDTESIAIAKTLGDALYDAVSGGMLDGIKAGKSSFGDLGIDIKKSLSTQILQGLIDGFLKSAVFQATVQPFLDKYIAAMKSGNSQALAEAASGLQGASATSNGQLQAFYQNVLVPTGQQLGVFGTDATTSDASTSASSQLGIVTAPTGVMAAPQYQLEYTAAITALTPVLKQLTPAVQALVDQGLHVTAETAVQVLMPSSDLRAHALYPGG